MAQETILPGVGGQGPAFPDHLVRFAEVPVRNGALEPKVRELILFALNTSVSHLHLPGIRRHLRGALDAGATPQEIHEVLQMISALGIHAVTIGVPILAELLAETREPPPLTAEQERLKADFQAKRGYWNAFWDGLLDLDPLFFEAYLEFSAHPWVHGVIPDKVKELLAIAWDASTTHMYEPGLRQHMANALGHGATPAEIMETLELAGTLGIQSYETALPILDEEPRTAGAGLARATPTRGPGAAR
jgi:alkylhydroperoxidase/carboxymuconolactone decarboxylase family protein YurZ